MIGWWLVTLFTAVVAENAVSPSQQSQKKEANAKFAGLLGQLVHVNERRHEVMKQMTVLQDYTTIPHDDLTRFGTPTLRSKEELYNLLNGKELGPTLLLISKTNKQNPQPVTDNDFSSDDSDSDLDNKIIDYIDDGPGEKSSLNNDATEVDSSRDDAFADLPIARNLKKVIRKKGSKYCVKGCKDALKNVCAMYRCRSKLKSRFKKDCKEYCKAEFGKGYYSGSD